MPILSHCEVQKLEDTRMLMEAKERLKDILRPYRRHDVRNRLTEAASADLDLELCADLDLER